MLDDLRQSIVELGEPKAILAEVLKSAVLSHLLKDVCFAPHSSRKGLSQKREQLDVYALRISELGSTMSSHQVCSVTYFSISVLISSSLSSFHSF